MCEGVLVRWCGCVSGGGCTWLDSEWAQRVQRRLLDKAEVEVEVGGSRWGVRWGVRGGVRLCDGMCDRVC